MICKENSHCQLIHLTGWQIYYSTMELATTHSRMRTQNQKIIHILQNIWSIFFSTKHKLKINISNSNRLSQSFQYKLSQKHRFFFWGGVKQSYNSQINNRVTF